MVEPRGLNDRRALPHLANGEFARAMNADLYQRNVRKRLGFERLGGPLMGGSIRLDGVNDYLRIKTYTDAGYDRKNPASNQWYFGIKVALRARPEAATPYTLFSWGYGSGANLIVDVRYDSDAGTGSLGAWILRVRDTSGGGATRTATLDYGDGTDSIVGVPVFLEAQVGTSSIEFRYYLDSSLTEAGSTSTTGVTKWNVGSATYDMFVGVGTTATNVIGTDFANATISELRIGAGTSVDEFLVTAINKFHTRGLTAAAAAALVGYWKMDDGGLEPRCADSSPTGNPALIVNNPPSWLLSSENSQVLGESAVAFYGGNPWVSINDTDGTKVTAVFDATGVANNKKRFTVRGVLILPALPAGYTTWPDGVILWAGTSTTDPAPIGLRIVSDAFEMKYNDGGTIRTPSTSSFPAVSTLAGKRMRWAIYRSGTGTGSITFGLTVDNGDGTITSYFTSTACSSTSPGSVSSDIALGRHVTNFANARLGDQTAFHTDGTLYGILDDIQFVYTSNNLVPLGTGAFAGTTIPGTVFTEQGQFGNDHTVHLWLKFNQGEGNLVKSIGSNTADAYGGWRVYLLPETDDGAAWDAGLVDPFLPERGTLLFPYTRFLNDGSRVRSLLVASGTTLSAYDDAGGLRVVGALPGRAEACTAAQYGSRVVIAGPVGRRPVVFDGATVAGCGIKPPSAPAAVTVANAAGSFVNGTYYLYVTFRSVQGDVVTESNPGPGVLVTFAGTDDTIDSVSLPRSSDPQVNQRRIWMTAVNGADGAAAYLVATVYDNSSTSYTDDITSVSTSAATLEYFDNEEAPAATTVGQLLDYTLLGGTQEHPTRLYYSAAGRPEYWNTALDGRYLDLDLDSGDPIIGIAPLLDRAIVDVGDGKWGIYATGDPTAPLAKTRINDTHGAVGPQAFFVSNNRQWYIGETDCFVSDGYRETNISSPDEAPSTAPVYVQSLGRTSIQKFLRDNVDWSGRSKFCVFEYRAKNQVWFCLRTTDAPSWLTGTNSHTLVFDSTDGRMSWWLYDIPIDTATWGEIEDEKAEPLAVVQGWLVKLDQNTDDGATTSGVLTIATKSNASTGTTLTFSGTPFSGDYRFLRAFVYHKSDNTIQEHRVVGVPTSASLLLESNDTTVAANDLVIVAAAPYYIDLVPQYGDPISTKRSLGVAMNVQMESASATLRIQHKGDVRSLPSTLSGYSSSSLALSSSIVSRWIGMGGLGTNFYVRVSETGYAAGTGQGVFPGGGAFTIHALEFEAHETDARSRW